jgi:heme-degrading monooxygenase HmoA
MKFKLLIFLLFGIICSSCTISRPLQGPGFASSGDRLNGDQERIVLIAITNAYLDRSTRKPFDEKTQELYKNLNSFEGYLGGSIRLRLLGKEVWTYTVWENEEALVRFTNSRDHLDAIYRNDQSIQKMRSMRIKILAKEIPISWDQVEQLISKQEFKNYTPL